MTDIIQNAANRIASRDAEHRNNYRRIIRNLAQGEGWAEGDEEKMAFAMDALKIDVAEADADLVIAKRVAEAEADIERCKAVVDDMRSQAAIRAELEEYDKRLAEETERLLQPKRALTAELSQARSAAAAVQSQESRRISITQQYRPGSPMRG